MMMGQNRKLIACAVLVSFFVSEISWADLSVLKREFPAEFRERIESLRRKPEGLIVSSSAASITDAHSGGSGKILIHIQDAHTNLGAQKNLAKILDEIIQQYGVDLIFVEGGTGNDSLSFLREYAGSDVRKRVAMRFLEKGEISGEEYLDIVSDKPFLLWGIEDPALYEKSLVTYARVVEIRKAALAYLNKITRAVDAVKPRIYSREFLEFEKAAVDFRKTGLTFTDYFDRLKTETQGSAVALGEFRELAKLEGVRLLEAGIDFKKADVQQAQIVRRISQSEPLFAGLAQAADKLKLGRTPVQAFYDTLESRMKEAGMILEDYPDFAGYLRYLKGFAAIDIRVLLEEIEELETALFGKYAGDPDSVRLRQITRYVDLLRNYFSLKLKPSEFQTYKKNLEDFRTASWLAYLNRKLVEFGRHADVVPTDAVLDDKQGQVEAFYRTVEARDHAFVERAFSKMEETDRPVAVLICGGYHTPHLKELMREKDASYVVVTPFVAEETDMQNYERVLMGSLDPTKRWMVSAREGTVRPPAAVSRGAVVPDIQSRLIQEDGLYGKDEAAVLNRLDELDRITTSVHDGRFKFRYEANAGEINVIFAKSNDNDEEGNKLILRLNAPTRAKFATAIPAPAQPVPAAPRASEPAGPRLNADEQQIADLITGSAGNTDRVAAAPDSRVDTVRLNPAFKEAADFMSAVAASVQLGPLEQASYVFDVSGGLTAVVNVAVSADSTVTATLIDANAETSEPMAPVLVLPQAASNEILKKLRREEALKLATAPVLTPGGKVVDARDILMKARLGRTDYMSRSRMIGEALKPMTIDTRLPVLVKIPGGALTPLLGVKNGRYFDGFMKLFIAEAIQARRQTFGINVYYGLDTDDPAVKQRLGLLLRELKAENAGDADYVREIALLETEIQDGFVPDKAKIVEIFDSVAGATGKSDIRIPLDLKIAEFEEGDGEVGAFIFRSILQVGIYAARTDLSGDAPEPLVNAYQTLMGRTISGSDRGLLASVLTGRTFDIESIAKFAIPPTIRIDINAIFELFNMMLRQLAKSA